MNRLHEACEGLFIHYGCSPRIYGNNLYDIQSYEETAIFSWSGATIENNRIRGSYRAVYIAGEWAQPSVIRGNLIRYAVWALDVRRSHTIIENNTIDQVMVGIDGAAGQDYVIRSNIIYRAEWGIMASPTDPPTMECNNVIDVLYEPYGVDIPDQTGINGNISIDPEFCGIDDSGNYFLQSDSPCAPGNHPDGLDCGLIGAFEVNCGSVSVRQSTWSAIKTKFRDRVTD